MTRNDVDRAFEELVGELSIDDPRWTRHVERFHQHVAVHITAVVTLLAGSAVLLAWGFVTGQPVWWFVGGLLYAASFGADRILDPWRRPVRTVAHTRRHR